MSDGLDRHGCGFEVITRDQNGRGVEWLAACRCGSKWTGPTYEATEDKWREHYHGIRGRAPKAMGDQSGRWKP